MGRTLLDLCRRPRGQFDESDKALLHQEFSKGLKTWFGVGLSAEEKIAVDEHIRHTFEPTLTHFARKQYPLLSAAIEGEDGAGAGAGAGADDDGGGDEGGAWLRDARSTLAAIILCDQFPRHIYRGKSESFAFDSMALSLARYMVRSKLDMELHPCEQVWVYMPFEHSEDMDDQRECVALLERTLHENPLVKEHGLEGFIKNNIVWAHKHLDMIEKFGRCVCVCVWLAFGSI